MSDDFRSVTLVDPFDDLVHRYWILRTRAQGFSACGHCVTLPVGGGLVDPGLLVDCVECIAWDDEIPAGLHQAMVIQDSHNATVDELARDIDSQILRDLQSSFDATAERALDEMTAGRSDALTTGRIDAPTTGRSDETKEPGER